MKIQSNLPHIMVARKNKKGIVEKESRAVNVASSSYSLSTGEIYTHYVIKDDMVEVGHVNLIDTENGVEVSFIRNDNPSKYSGIGRLADQIEVEHCLKRGLENFEITSEASMNSHAYHFLRGKRFSKVIDENRRKQLLKDFSSLNVNKIVKHIIDTTPQNTIFHTEKIGEVPMYMPKSLIKKYIKLAKEHPLLK